MTPTHTPQHSAAKAPVAAKQAPDAPSKPQRRRQPYRRSGAHALARALRARGIAGIDQRTALARSLRAWRDEYVADLGGEVTTGQATLLEALAGELAILRVIDATLSENPDWIVNRRRRVLGALAGDRASVAARVRELCVALGVERRAREVPSLSTYLLERASRAARAPAETEKPLTIDAEVISSPRPDEQAAEAA